MQDIRDAGTRIAAQDTTAAALTGRINAGVGIAQKVLGSTQSIGTVIATLGSALDTLTKIVDEFAEVCHPATVFGITNADWPHSSIQFLKFLGLCYHTLTKYAPSS